MRASEITTCFFALHGKCETCFWLHDIFESDDRSIFIERPRVEETSLPDVLEHWTLREYVELVGVLACRERVKQTSQFAQRIVVDGGTRIDRGF